MSQVFHFHFTLPPQMSFDFVDLDEESFSDLKHFNNFPKFPQISPLLTLSAPTNTEESSVFIRSASPINLKIEESKESLFILPVGTLRFNQKGPFHEGRDSQVFRGELVGNETIEVAVKVYKSDESALQGAQKELKIAQFITKGRPDFLKLFYSGPIAETEFISVWEWIEGGTIDRVINKLSDSQIKNVIRSLAHSIAYLHSFNLAHHDIKPQNILMTSDRIILIDFGDSKLVNNENNANKDDCKNNNGYVKSDTVTTSDTHVNSNTHITDNSASLIPLDEGIGLGTLAYTAPELLSRKSQFYDPFAADVYSFGVLLFYLLNRGAILPFHSLVPHRAVQLILTVQKGFFAGGYNPEKPRDSPIYPLMLKCLHVDPKERPKFPEIIKFINSLE